MKKLFTILALLVAFAAIPAQAQFENSILVSKSEYYNDFCLRGLTGQTYTVFLYLMNPINYDFGDGEIRSVYNVGGFECRLHAEGDVIILDKRFPVPSIDVGQAESMIVGFSEPVLVNGDGLALLAEVDVFLAEGSDPVGTPDKVSPLPCDGATGFLYLYPSYPPSIEGRMAYLDWDDPDNPVVGADRLWDYDDYPSLMLEPIIVATEDQSWGSIKAIYR